MESSKKVNLRPIDPEKLKIDLVQGSKDTYGVILELDSLPDGFWTWTFHDILGKERKIGDATITEGYVTIFTIPDAIKVKIEWIKKIVDCTNQQVEIHNKQVEEEREETRRSKAKSEEEIKKMRELLKK
jgi:hypothetical protein